VRFVWSYRDVYRALDVAVNRSVVKSLCLLQVFNWKVKDIAFETAKLFSDFYAVCYVLYSGYPHLSFIQPIHCIFRILFALA